jgi:hypothetical protein
MIFFVIARSEATKQIQSFSASAGLLRGACHRAARRIRFERQEKPAETATTHLEVRETEN